MGMERLLKITLVEMSRSPTFIIDRRLKVVASNKLGTMLLQQAGPLTLSSCSVLRFATRTVNDRFVELMRRFYEEGCVEVWHYIAPVAMFEVRPLVVGGSDEAVVAIRGLDRATGWSEGEVAQMLDLPTAQARLALGLANGSTLDSHAEAWNIEKCTAKYHLRQLLRKFEADKQPDLVRKLCKVLA
jgi:hypothetical protein